MTEKTTIGRVAEGALREGKTNEEVLATIKEAFPDSNTSMASVNWYRHKMIADGEPIKTSREIRKERRAASKNAG